MSDGSGATSIEYGLIASLIAVAAVQSFELVGNDLTTTFTTASEAMSTADEAPPPAADDEGP